MVAGDQTAKPNETILALAQIRDAAIVNREALSGIVNKEALAAIFGKSERSIERAVQRGELPPPTPLFGQSTWTAGAIIRHIEGRLAAEAQERERSVGKIQSLRP